MSMISGFRPTAVPVRKPAVQFAGAGVAKVDAANFDAEVVQASSQTPVLVDFYANWCGPCLKLAPTIDALAAANQGKVKVVKVDIDNDGGVSQRFPFRTIPTLYLFRNGTYIAFDSQAMPRTQQGIQTWLDQNPL